MPEEDPCDEYPPNPHLGNPALVKWGSENVGDNTNIKVPFVSKEVEYVRGYYEVEGEDAESEGGGTDRWIEKVRSFVPIGSKVFGHLTSLPLI